MTDDTISLVKSKRTVGGLIAAVVVALLTWWVYGDDGAPQETPPSEPSVSVPGSRPGTIDTEITAPFGTGGDAGVSSTVPGTSGTDTSQDTTENDIPTTFGQDATKHSLATTTTVAIDPTTMPVSGVDPESGLQWVVISELPPEAHTTLGLIDSGGPYPYDQDGATFENREGILPDHPIGYYREFTVDTPGEDDRGARRIVVGDGGEFYYTGDHYESFERISR